MQEVSLRMAACGRRGALVDPLALPVAVVAGPSAVPGPVVSMGPRRKHSYHVWQQQHQSNCRAAAAAEGQTLSWFVMATEFCSRVVSTIFSQLLYCLSPPDTDEFADFYSLKRFAEHNKESMDFLAAVFTGNESRARELLLMPQTNINAQYANGDTALILAAQGHNLRLVQLMLSHPEINVNQRGQDGVTALMSAVPDRNDVVAALVADPRVDVNAVSYREVEVVGRGGTALTHAIRWGNEDAVSLLLLRADLDVNYQTRDSYNALLDAIAYHRLEAVQHLLRRPDLDVDVVDHRDRTPLIMAVQYGYAFLVRQLLFLCCDPSAEDDTSRNALYYALKRGHAEMVSDIMEATSEPQSLKRLCRTTIRRYLRTRVVGFGEPLRPTIRKIRVYDLPISLRAFLAHEPTFRQQASSSSS